MRILLFLSVIFLLISCNTSTNNESSINKEINQVDSTVIKDDSVKSEDVTMTSDTIFYDSSFSKAMFPNHYHVINANDSLIELKPFGDDTCIKVYNINKRILLDTCRVKVSSDLIKLYYKGGEYEFDTFILINGKKVKKLHNFIQSDIYKNKILFTEIEFVEASSRLFIFDITFLTMDTLSIRGDGIFVDSNTILICENFSNGNSECFFYNLVAQEKKPVFLSEDHLEILKYDSLKKEIYLEGGKGIYKYYMNDSKLKIVYNGELWNPYLTSDYRYMYDFICNYTTKKSFIKRVSLEDR